MIRRPAPFEKLENFRDCGGYGAAGRVVRKGRLYRSGHHAQLTDADLAGLQALDLGLVVDLRRPSERRDQPSRRPAGFSAGVIEISHDDGGEAPHVAFLKSGRLTRDSGRRFMIRVYGGMPFDPGHRDAFGRFFRQLAGADRPVLIHCAAGKDRTGFLAALTHHLLGVSHDDMLADYLATNAAVDLEGRAPAMAKKLEALTGHAPSRDAVTAFLGVEAEYLETAFAAVKDRHGSVDAYLEQALGVDAALRDRIGERLTA